MLQNRVLKLNSCFYLVLILAWLSACNKTAAYDSDSLIKDIDQSGNSVVRTGEAIDQGFSIKGARIQVNRENIYIYEFVNAAATDSNAEAVSPDGYNITLTYGEQRQPGPGGVVAIHRHNDWIYTPHFYKRGKLIVIYAGDNKKLTSLLEKLLGQQFAGGKLYWRTQSYPYPAPD